MKIIPWREVNSAVILQVAYYPKDLYIRFQTGGVYIYHDVPPEVVQAFLKAPSLGAYFQEKIRGVYDYDEQ